MPSFFEDTHFWILLSFLGAFYIGFRYGRGSVLSALDARSTAIRNKIEESENLRIEAQELLSVYRHKYRDAMKEADTIIKDAQIQAGRAREKAIDEIKEKITRMEEQAKKRLLDEQEAAIAEVRGKVSEEAIHLAAETLKNTVRTDDLERLNTHSIRQIAGLSR